MSDMIESLASYTKVYLAYKLKKTRLLYSPIQVSIEPTNICNFKCGFCNQSDPDHFNKRTAGRINLQDYEVILDKIKEGCRDVKVISLTLDGEPALHKNLPQMIEKANKKGFFVRFSSNGSLIDLEFLEKTKALSFLISIDFSLNKDWFERYRGKNGSWDLVNKNLQEIINYLDFNKNLHLEIFEGSAYYDGLEQSYNNLKLLKGHFGEIYRLTYGLRIYHGILNGDEQCSLNNRYHGCFYPWTSLTIAWNGDAVTCCRDLDGRYVLGNVLNRSIEGIWNGQKYLRLRKAVLKEELSSIPSCRSCDLPYDRGRNRWSYVIKKMLRKW